MSYETAIAVERTILCCSCSRFVQNVPFEDFDPVLHPTREAFLVVLSAQPVVDPFRAAYVDGAIIVSVRGGSLALVPRLLGGFSGRLFLGLLLFDLPILLFLIGKELVEFINATATLTLVGLGSTFVIRIFAFLSPGIVVDISYSRRFFIAFRHGDNFVRPRGVSERIVVATQMDDAKRYVATMETRKEEQTGTIGKSIPGTCTRNYTSLTT
mmetsp:Transcript_28148/g.76332  ORF Transcript_28148/g.76332 Transcript_28148/m.76332 type:complete len:212 (-) Transcript_28148:23-658(-)